MKRYPDPDGKVHLTFDDGNRFGIYTWNETSNEVDEEPYMLDYSFETRSTPGCTRQRAVCIAPHQSWAYYEVGGKVVTISQTVMFDSTQPLEVSYIYPATRTSWTTSYTGVKPDFARVIGDKLAIYGSNGDGHVFTLVDVSGSTPTGQILIGPGAAIAANRTDIAMSDGEYLPETNQFIFSGALASGHLVTGTYDLTTGAMVLTNIGATGAISDIEAIGPEPLVG
jgi:hypothetical protein